MGKRHWRQLLIGVLCIALLSPSLVLAQGFSTAYDRGYREGVQQGERDGRDGRNPQFERSSVYRDADRGYQDRYGNRDQYQNEFRRGFASGYREGYNRSRVNVYDGRRDGGHDPSPWRGGRRACRPAAPGPRRVAGTQRRPAPRQIRKTIALWIIPSVRNLR